MVNGQSRSFEFYWTCYHMYLNKNVSRYVDNVL